MPSRSGVRHVARREFRVRAMALFNTDAASVARGSDNDVLSETTWLATLLLREEPNGTTHVTSGAGETDDAALSPTCGMNPTLTRFLYEWGKSYSGHPKYTPSIFESSRRASYSQRGSDEYFAIATRLKMGVPADAVAGSGRRATGIPKRAEAQ